MADLQINSIDDLKGHLSDLYGRNDVSKIEERVTALEQAQNDKNVVDNRDVNEDDNPTGSNDDESNHTVGNDNEGATSDDNNQQVDDKNETNDNGSSEVENNQSSQSNEDLDELSKILGLS